MSVDPELEAFKTEIDLRAFAADYGYSIDEGESWPSSSVMRHENGDKLFIKRAPCGHYVYFSVRNDRDHGSIIDFLQKRRRPCSLGQVRQALRPWIGRTSPAPSSFPAIEKTSIDRIEVERNYQRMQDAPRHSYLEIERGISAALLGAPRFAGRVRTDRLGNAIFPHFDIQGLCGFEIKNKRFTGFAHGGRKGLWFSRTEAADNCLVLAESAIDALSHAQLFPNPGARYGSIGGQVSKRQPALIQAAISKMPGSSEIIGAMDADPAGRKLAEVVRRSVIETGRPDLRFTVSLPEGAKDWNDVLRGRPSTSSPTALSEAREAAAR